MDLAYTGDARQPLPAEKTKTHTKDMNMWLLRRIGKKKKKKAKHAPTTSNGLATPPVYARDVQGLLRLSQGRIRVSDIRRLGR